MGQLFDLEATNGDCLAELEISTRLRLHCIEELGDEYTRNKNYACVWIPVTSKAFWSMIKAICDKNVQGAISGDNVLRELAAISKHAEELIKRLEE